MVLNEVLHQNLAGIFSHSQDGAAAHSKLIIKCQSIYKETQFEEFFETFTFILQNALIVTAKNPYLDKVIDFVTKFATSLSTSQQAGDATLVADTTRKTQNEENITVLTNQTQQTTILEDDNIFLTSLIEHLIEISRANSDVVRYRCCQILSKLMVAISNDQFIDEDLYDRLSDSLLERLKDVNSRVQAQAISAIYRLQDPNDKDCRISTAFLFLMQFDPNWQVRFQALSHIAFSKQTLPDIIDRVRDPHPSVRRKALLILSEKVLIKFISIEKRLFILNYALKDEDTTVVETCCKKLLPSWLVFKENDVCKLLKALDVVEATETMELMLERMFSEHSSEQLYKEFSHNLGDNHVIPCENLNAESAFYWSWICGKIKKLEKDRKNEFEQCDEDDCDYLDKLVPSLTEYCEYVQQVLKIINEENMSQVNLDHRKQIENTFITKQLINMFAFIDFSDPHGKKTLQKLCHDLFADRNYTFIFDEIMKIYRLVVPNLQQRINNIVELISDIKEQTSVDGIETDAQSFPVMDSMNEETNLNPGIEKNILDATSIEIEEPIGQAPKMNPRELALKISELKFQRLNHKEEFDKLYKAFKSDSSVDINMLSELRSQISKCEEEIVQLQDQLNGNAAAASIAAINQARLSSKNATPITCPNTPSANTNANVIDVEEEEEIDPIVLIDHCLRLAICLLQDIELKAITPHIRSLFDNLILDNISSVDEQIRVLSVRALNLICILKLEIAQKYVPLLLEMIQRDKKLVVIEAFKAMINCIMAYSLNRLVSMEDDFDKTTNKNRKSISNEADVSRAEATTKVISIMTSLLDNEDCEIYTIAVEGFCKLYMTGHIISAKLFSKLLIMYYSPITENDTQLRAILSSFLPQFSFFRGSNQLCVEESFMLTAKCLINAQPDSYLSEIDLIKVAEILFNLTNPKNLIKRKASNQRQIQSNNICHENIFRSICFEILKDDNVYKLKTYIKLLQMADLTSADYLALKSLHQLATDVHDHIEDKDKLLAKTAKKLYENIQASFVKNPEYIKEQQEKEIQSTAETAEAETLRSVDSESQDSEAVEHSNRNSGDLIDPRFQKLKKKVLTKEQLIRKAMNNTSNKTLSVNDETKLNETAKKSIFKQKEAKNSKKKDSSESNSENEVTIISKKQPNRKTCQTEQDISLKFKSRRTRIEAMSDDLSSESGNELNNKSLRRSSPRVSNKNQREQLTTSTAAKVAIRDIRINLKRIDMSLINNITVNETLNETVKSKEDDSLRVQLLRSRSERLNNESVNRSKSLCINDTTIEATKPTTKRTIDVKNSGKSNNRRAQSADISHDQSNIGDDEPPVKKGRTTKTSKKSDDQATTGTRSASNRGNAKVIATEEAARSSSTSLRRSNRKSNN